MDTKSKNNFSHYFTQSNHSDKDFFQFNFDYMGNHFIFTSCDDVFSKKEIDEGSLILIDTVLKNDLRGDILDIACGYGAIGVIIGKICNIAIDMCDINNTAIKLCKINAKNNLNKTGDIFESDMWENVGKKYDHILSNPPIKVGKKVLISFLNGISSHLNVGGDVTIVIKKNLGADSTKKYLKELFGNVEVLERSKGYYILKAVKTVE